MYPRLPRIILTVSVLNAGSVIIMDSIFNFLGFSYYTGWGSLTRLSLSQPHIWWAAMFLGIAIVLTVLCLNFLGAWLRERLELQPGDPQHGLTEANASVLEPSGK